MLRQLLAFAGELPARKLTIDYDRDTDSVVLTSGDGNGHSTTVAVTGNVIEKSWGIMVDMEIQKMLRGDSAI